MRSQACSAESLLIFSVSCLRDPIAAVCLVITRLRAHEFAQSQSKIKVETRMEEPILALVHGNRGSHVVA